MRTMYISVDGLRDRANGVVHVLWEKDTPDNAFIPIQVPQTELDNNQRYQTSDSDYYIISFGKVSAQ